MPTRHLSPQQLQPQTTKCRNIQSFSVETAGTFDLDAELKIWVSHTNEPIELRFGKGPAASAKNVIITTSSENQMLVFDQNGALSDFSQDYEITIQS
ncbi:MAG TPA: hypothetical protein EYQ03_08300, partial [Nitrospinaceae bacterium]|nr:hypothetical protein [Nitrospinaceae bacterium]